MAKQTQHLGLWLPDIGTGNVGALLNDNFITVDNELFRQANEHPLRTTANDIAAITYHFLDATGESDVVESNIGDNKTLYYTGIENIALRVNDKSPWHQVAMQSTTDQMQDTLDGIGRIPRLDEKTDSRSDFDIVCDHLEAHSAVINTYSGNFQNIGTYSKEGDQVTATGSFKTLSDFVNAQDDKINEKIQTESTSLSDRISANTKQLTVIGPTTVSCTLNRDDQGADSGTDNKKINMSITYTKYGHVVFGYCTATINNGNNSAPFNFKSSWGGEWKCADLPPISSEWIVDKHSWSDVSYLTFSIDNEGFHCVFTNDAFAKEVHRLAISFCYIS